MRRTLGVAVLLAAGTMGCKAADSSLARASNGVRPEDSVSAEPAGPIEVVEDKYPNGNPKSRIEGYRDADGSLVRHGTSTLWFQNEQKKSEQQFAHGVPHGPRTTWYLEGGRLWTQGSYVDGLEDGKYVAFYLDGTQQSEWTMKRGAWHGKFTEWHTNGKKRLEVEFVEGKRQGPAFSYDDQGVVVLRTDYVDGIEQP